MKGIATAATMRCVFFCERDVMALSQPWPINTILTLTWSSLLTTVDEVQWLCGRAVNTKKPPVLAQNVPNPPLPPPKCPKKTPKMYQKTPGEGCEFGGLYGVFLVHFGREVFWYISGGEGAFVSDLLRPGLCGIIVERDRTIVQSDLSGSLDLIFIRCYFSCISPTGGGCFGTANMTQICTDGCGRGGGVVVAG